MKKDSLYFWTAFTMSLIWVASSGIYDYKAGNSYLLGINMFPLFLWTLGLFFLKKYYDFLGEKNGLIKIILVYWILLFSIEAIGYHFLKIQLDSAYSGVLGLDVIHVPFFAKIYYLAAGPVYLYITRYLEGW